MWGSKAMRRGERERHAQANRPDRRRVSLSSWKPGMGSGRGRRFAPLCPSGTRRCRGGGFRREARWAVGREGAAQALRPRRLACTQLWYIDGKRPGRDPASGMPLNTRPISRCHAGCRAPNASSSTRNARCDRLLRRERVDRAVQQLGRRERAAVGRGERGGAALPGGARKSGHERGVLAGRGRVWRAARSTGAYDSQTSTERAASNRSACRGVGWSTRKTEHCGVTAASSGATSTRWSRTATPFA